METLPAELKQYLCDFLDCEDLSTVRVVNKTWAHVAALQLFEGITITPLSLERLRLIVQHEVIAKCVKRISFHTDLLPSILPEMWHEGLIRSSRTWTVEGQALRYHRYVLACREQQRLGENNHKLNREIIELSIPILRRLQCLQLTVGGDLHVSHQIDSPRRPNQQWSKVWSDLRRHVLDEQGASQRETEISKQFTILLNTPAMSGVHIRKLSLINISVSVWHRALQLRQEPYCAGLTTVKSIYLDDLVFFRHLHHTADGHCEVKALGMFLEAAQSLQTLKLHGKLGGFSPNDFLQCFRPSLPKLSRLSLSANTATERSLIDTLMTYRATLARLNISLVELIDGNTGSWHQFFRRVPESLPCLFDVRLRSLYACVPGPRGRWSLYRSEPPYLKAVEHAILTGTDIPYPAYHVAGAFQRTIAKRLHIITVRISRKMDRCHAIANLRCILERDL